MTRSEYQKQRRTKFKELGLCVQCGKLPPRDGKTTCQACGEKLCKAMKQWQAKATDERKSLGLCSCGKPTSRSNKTCDTCGIRNRKNYYKRKELGLCAYCGNTTAHGETRCAECKTRLKEKNRQLKLEVFKAYGGPICACCGETIVMFLTLDHANDNGKEHRLEVGRTSVLKWLKQNDFPPGYQVLCFNCNLGRYLNGGVCPHKEKHDRYAKPQGRTAQED